MRNVTKQSSKTTGWLGAITGALAAAIVLMGAGAASAAPDQLNVGFNQLAPVASTGSAGSGTVTIQVIQDGSQGAFSGFNYQFPAGVAITFSSSSCAINGTPTGNGGNVTTVSYNSTFATTCSMTWAYARATSGTLGLTTNNGVSASGIGFTNVNVVPSVVSIAPTSGFSNGGTSVVITGVGFTGVTGANGVQFGATNAASYVVNSNTQITAVSPALALGTSSVRVNNGGLSPDVAGDDFFVAQAIPTLSEWAMILFGLILAGGAALYIQRRQLTA